MLGSQSPDARRMQARLEAELSPGERVQWQAMPIPRWFEPGSLVVFLFGLPWTAFAVVWTLGAAWGVSKANGPWFVGFFPLFGVPFILVGLGMLSMPCWARLAARRTIYAITDRRALIIQGIRTVETRSFAPNLLSNLLRRDRRDGSGDVLFSRKEWRDSDGDRSVKEIGFVSIPEPRKVEALLRELAERHGKPVSDQT